MVKANGIARRATRTSPAPPSWPQAPDGGVEIAQIVRKEDRLTKDMEYKRVRIEGQSWAHPLLVLSAAQNTHVIPPQDQPLTRWGFAVGRKMGKAVRRNRVRRLLKEAVRYLRPYVRPGYDIVLIGRGDIANVKLQDVIDALEQLLRRARLLTQANLNPAAQIRQALPGGQRKDVRS